jgi:hypothetical protein
MKETYKSLVLSKHEIGGQDSYLKEIFLLQ